MLKKGDFQETAWLCTRGTPSGSKVYKAKRKPDVRRGTWNMEHGTWSQRATANRNRSLTELVTSILMSKQWKVLLGSNSNLKYDKTVLQINKKRQERTIKNKAYPNTCFDIL